MFSYNLNFQRKLYRNKEFSRACTPKRALKAVACLLAIAIYTGTKPHTMPMMSIGPIPKAGYVIYAVETSNKLFEVTVTAIFTDRSRQAQAKSRRPGQ